LRFASLTLAAALTVAPLFAQNAPPGAWLDGDTLKGWNKPGGPLPKATASRVALDAVVARCKLAVPRSTAAERAVADAGWIPFLPFDRQIADQGLEVVGGMTDTDETCAPSMFTLFVFADDRFAGTLSPELMSPKTDGVAATVRITGPDTISTEYSRYSRSDPGCCPSARVRVTFKVERSGQPVAVPQQLRVTR
jgi:hypothetical protein